MTETMHDKAEITLRKNNERGQLPRLSIPITSDLKQEIDLLVKENGTSITRLVTKMIEDSMASRQGATSDRTHAKSIDIAEIEDSLLEYTRLINDSSEAYLEVLETTNETLKKASINSSNSLRLSTTGLKNAVEEAEMTINQGSKAWGDLLDTTSSMKNILKENLSFHIENKELRETFKGEVKSFKKQLIYESHDYRKNLARFAIKTYCIGLCFMAVGTAGFYLVQNYMP